MDRDLKYFCQLSYRLGAWNPSQNICKGVKISPMHYGYALWQIFLSEVYELPKNGSSGVFFFISSFLQGLTHSAVNVPQRLWRLLPLGAALPLYWLPAALVVLWAAPVVLESEERSDKNRGLPAQRSHRYRRANCYTSIC